MKTWEMRSAIKGSSTWRRGIAAFLVGVIGFGVAGCGSGGGDSQRVNDVRFLANDIVVGESVRVEVLFEAERDFADIEAVNLIFEVDPALSLEEFSFEIFEGDDDDTDRVGPPQVARCADGRTLARLFLQRDDLRGNNFGDNFKLKFNVTGARPSDTATVAAAAGDDRIIDCATGFFPQATDAVRVTAR